MAGLNHQLKASTLVESLIAMVILIVCLGIGTMVFTNILNSDKERKELHASLLANEFALKVKAQQNFLDDEEEIGEWTLKKTVEKYKDADNLYQLSIAVIDGDHKIVLVRRELIIVE